MIAHWFIFLMVIAAGLIFPRSADAAISCSISTVGVAFGSYNVFSSSPLTSTGHVSIRCQGIGAGVAPVAMTLGPGNSSSFQPRKMFHGTATLSYNLYLDAGASQIWGDGTGGTVKYSTAVGNNQTVNVTIFGSIPPSQDVSVGTYSDTIVATINF